jgi:hypothetical protein
VQANGQSVPPAATSVAAVPVEPRATAPINGDLLPALDPAARVDNAKPRAAPRRAPLPLKA